MNSFIPIPAMYMSFLVANDRANLHLVLLIGAIALGWIFLLRWFWKPMGAAYWLVGSFPSVIGTLLGMYQYDKVIYILSHEGWAHPILPEDVQMEGILTVHYGLFLSGALYLVVLYFYARDFLFPRCANKSPLEKAQAHLVLKPIQE